jgi:hypothetical protein
MSDTQGHSIADTPASGNGAGPHVGVDFAGAEDLQSSQGRPELAVGAAFVGGFVLALLLRRARS